ncbi:hypothetical protein HPB50_024832 [Hyalomma asiaticum]|uniref:Uncharacterized protein n=1 Tax=Hyalomma asiaticum TaxID=266040 RepID=A0ACB7T9K5_HYAAI|nr:hypothetical protein HPB50_024832 [Hyalomma asiaticum]
MDASIDAPAGQKAEHNSGEHEASGMCIVASFHVCSSISATAQLTSVDVPGSEAEYYRPVDWDTVDPYLS